MSGLLVLILELGLFWPPIGNTFVVICFAYTLQNEVVEPPSGESDDGMELQLTRSPTNCYSP